MKKTVTINISGIIFNIDEDAFNRLQNYLTDINARFSNAEEGREIITDIEARIAELFTGKINPQKQVITIEDVEEMVCIMGNPSDFGGDDNAPNESEKQASSEKGTGKKRIYRDTDNRVLGGVCSGLGAYFNIDPVFIRILMVISFFAFGPLLYIILWIAIPKAKTTAQKLEMKGEKVNISNIEKSIREEFDEVKQNFKNINKSKVYADGQSFVEKMGQLFLTVFGSLAKIFVVIIGVFLLFVGLSLLIGFLSTTIFGLSDISIGDHSMTLSQFFNVFFDSDAGFLLILSLILVSIIPIIGILYSGIRLIFKINPVNKIVGITLTILWFLSITCLIVFGITEASNFRYSGQADQAQKFNDNIKMKSVILQMDESNLLTEENKHIDLNNIYLDFVNDKPVMKGVPMLDIVKSDSNYIEINYISIARGETQKQAKETAKKINYELSSVKLDSISGTFVFTPYFNVGTIDKWRNQKLKITMKIPVGDTIYLDKSIAKLLYDIDNSANMADEDMTGKKWVMKQEGLTLIQ